MNDEQAPGGAGPVAAPGEPAVTGEEQAREGVKDGPPLPEDLQRDLEEARKSAQSLRDQFLRKAAEFENYKRRTEAEYLTTVRNANEGLINALLPIVEDLVRSLKSSRPQGEGEAFYRGVEMIYQKLMRVLEGQGLAPFESLGKPFDVNEHDALLQVARGDVPPGTVVEEIARGYRLNDKVLRHARVVVSSGVPPESAPESASSAGDNEESAPE